MEASKIQELKVETVTPDKTPKWPHPFPRDMSFREEDIIGYRVYKRWLEGRGYIRLCGGLLCASDPEAPFELWTSSPASSVYRGGGEQDVLHLPD